MAKESNGRSCDEEPFSVSIDTSNVESELEGKDLLKTKIS